MDCSFEHRHGYFQALLDISNFIDNHSESLKHRYKYRKLEAVHAIIKYLLQNGHVLDEFMRYGGVLPEFKLSNYDKKSGISCVSIKLD